MDVRTRVAIDSDLPFLCGVDRHVSPDEQAQLVALGRVMVAEADGAPVGCLRWGLFWDQVPFMNLLWIVPGRRRQGVGSALVKAWESSQLGLGRTFVLTSTVSAETAQHFYRQLGYVDCGSLVLPDEPTELILRKPLSK